MRLYIHTSPNRQTVPFDYQSTLVSAFHRWLGPNALHDSLSLYSLSWLSAGRASKQGLRFYEGSQFFISCPDSALFQQLIGQIQASPQIDWGMEVRELLLEPPPDFGESETFFLQSPVLIQRDVDTDAGRNKRFYYVDDPESDALMTETLQRKLAKAGKGHLSVSVSFDRSYPRIKTKAATYKGITSKGTLCPVIVEGDAEAVRFAWEVGIGNSTGIGWGALK